MEASKGVDVSRADEYTVATWLRSWYDIYAKPNVRAATADRYRLMIEQYAIPRIGSIKLTKLTAHDLQKLYKELMESGRTNRKSGYGNPGLSSATVRSLHLMLHNALNRAVKERLILRNPTDATLALQNGVDVKTVSSMLGHYDAGFTLRTYTHATRQKQDEAAQTMGSFMAQVM